MIENFLEAVIFRSRWLLAPFFIGLVFSILLLLIKFLEELFHLSTQIFLFSENDVIVSILALVDIALVGSLLLMIIFSGYEIFVSKIDVANHKDRPDWMGKVNFSGLKLKVIGAIVAISAIDLLKTFMNLSDTISPSEIDTIFWKLALHMSFVISGVLFAVMDKVASMTEH
ncbi:MAG: TIGR00645 family protein [Gammaproteobacteria bacterium]|nr:TIGR00645 family protein [Gammaproteobacteria bacterium]